MQKTPVQSLGWEDPLEKEMVTPSNILAWKIPWTEEPGGVKCLWFLKMEFVTINRVKVIYGFSNIQIGKAEVLSVGLNYAKFYVT